MNLSHLFKNLEAAQEFLSEIAKISGGYHYLGVVSDQVCFPLKAGGELRFSISEDEDEMFGPAIMVDLYDGALPPGMSGPVYPTGETCGRSE